MEEKKSISINLIASIVVLIVNLGINFFLTPYVTGRLGTEAYGFASLASNFVNYATLLTIALNSMSGRFISIAIHKGKEKEADEYFSSVFWSNVLIIAILIIPSVFLIAKLENVVNIPSNIVYDVKVLFSLIFMNFFFGILNSTYQVATFATNKLYIQSINNLVGNIIKVTILLTAFMFFVPHVFYIGLASLITTLYIFLMNIYYKKKLLPSLKNDLHFCSFKKIKEVTLAGIWNTVTKLAQILTDGLDLIICNIFIDSLAMGQLAIAKTLGSTLGTLIGTVSAVFQPEFIISYAKEKGEELIKKLTVSMKITAIFANIPFCFLIVFGRAFYNLWMPNQDVELLYVLTLLTVQGVIVSGIINPMYSIYTVTNKIKADALCRIVLGFTSVILVFVLLKFTNLGIYAVAGVSTLLGTTFNFFFVPTYVARKCLNVKWNTFYPTIFRYMFTVAIMVLIFYFGSLFIEISSWYTMFATIFCAGIIGLGINFILLFNKEEQIEFIKTINKFILKIGGKKSE